MDCGNLNQRRESIVKGFEDDFEKARSGTYADTAQNRKLGRVGQKYGSSGKEEGKSTKKKSNESGSSKKVDYDKMHNTELNATYKKKFKVESTNGINRAEMVQALKSGKPVKQADSELQWEQHLADDPQTAVAQLEGMTDRVLNASMAADELGDKEKSDKLMKIYDKMRYRLVQEKRKADAASKVKGNDKNK